MSSIPKVTPHLWNPTLLYKKQFPAPSRKTRITYARKTVSSFLTCSPEWPGYSACSQILTLAVAARAHGIPKAHFITSDSTTRGAFIPKMCTVGVSERNIQWTYSFYTCQPVLPGSNVHVHKPVCSLLTQKYVHIRVCILVLIYRNILQPTNIQRWLGMRWRITSLENRVGI